MARAVQGFLVIMACRFVTVFFILAALLQIIPVSAASLVASEAASGAVPGTQTAEYYLRGKNMNFAIEDDRQQLVEQDSLWQGRDLSVEDTSFEADFVQGRELADLVADYVPPCANKKNDPSVCKHG